MTWWTGPEALRACIRVIPHHVQQDKRQDAWDKGWRAHGVGVYAWG